MIRLIVLRLLAAVPVMLVVATFVFLLLRLSPGDPALVVAGEQATPEQVEQIRRDLGLDRSLPVQYVTWLSQMAQGNFGASTLSGQPVLDLIADRVEPTLVLALVTIVVTVVIAVPLGAIAAWHHDGWRDRMVMTLAVVGFSVPSFVIGYTLMQLLALKANLLPVQGYISPFDDPLQSLKHLVLPAATLAIVFMALISRVTRASTLEILGEDFIRTARAKGGNENRILWKHALPNAAVPVVTVIGLGIASLISGVVVTESVFNIPGLGRLTIDAILGRDYPVVQGLILVFSLTYVFINLLIDITYLIVDPRIRY
ncbi:ABC transporter permease [Frigidibacter sp.]|uniref:ABC transporter permease n=1 Tax=Frigidibacter sp. TaxID=2586418 RepID=UPI0027338204|nr:ABC transporter permease [Frigidibacter sp.]MDP3340597.1 ABC transporter permease [Frigidibacter sp.]